MEIRSSAVYKDNKRIETKEIYFDINDIRIELEATKYPESEVPFEEDESDYIVLKEEEMKNPFETLLNLLSTANKYIKDGWNNVNIRIQSITKDVTFQVEIRNYKLNPISTFITIPIELINKDCAEKLAKINKILRETKKGEK